MRYIKVFKDILGKTYKKNQENLSNILKRNAQKEQEPKAFYQHQTSQGEQPRQEHSPEKQERHDESINSFSSSVGIPSLGLFDTINPVCDPEDEDFRRRLQQKKKKKRGPSL